MELKLSRISRAVRQTLALEAKLEGDIEATAAAFRFNRETAVRNATDAAFQANRMMLEHRFAVKTAVTRANEDTPTRRRWGTTRRVAEKADRRFNGTAGRSRSR